MVSHQGLDSDQGSKSEGGQRPIDDRRVMSGIIHRLRTGCQWEAIPAEFGSGQQLSAAGVDQFEAAERITFTPPRSRRFRRSMEHHLPHICGVHKTGAGSP